MSPKILAWHLQMSGSRAGEATMGHCRDGREASGSRRHGKESKAMQGKQSRESNGEEAGDRNETNASNNRRSRDGKQWREEREGKAWYECSPLKPFGPNIKFKEALSPVCRGTHPQGVVTHRG